MYIYVYIYIIYIYREREKSRNFSEPLFTQYLRTTVFIDIFHSAIAPDSLMASDASINQKLLNMPFLCLLFLCKFRKAICNCKHYAKSR